MTRTVLTRPMPQLVLLFIVSAFALSVEVSPHPYLSLVAGVALLIWLVLEWRRLALVAQLTSAGALLIALAIWMFGEMDLDLLARAIGRAAFFAWFLLAMDILRTAAMSSRMVLTTGQALVNQPPGRRYAILTLGSHMLSILLSMGAVTLLATMARRSIEAQKGKDSDEIREIRLRRMTMAISRGFTAFTLWTPTAVTVLVVLAAIPELDWQHFAVQGVATAAAFLGFGWLLDRLTYRRRSAPTVVSEPLSGVLKRLLPLTLLTLAILASALTVSQITGLRIIAALLITVPFFGLGWIAVQYRRAGYCGAIHLAARRTWREVLPELTTLRTELAVLSAAGFIAVLLPQQVDTVALANVIAASGLSGGAILVLMMWLIGLTAPIGMNPIISVAVCIEILARMPSLEIPPGLLAFAGTLAWGLANSISPLAASVRVTGRVIGRSANQIGLGWNLQFAVLVTMAASVILLIFA